MKLKLLAAITSLMLVAMLAGCNAASPASAPSQVTVPSAPSTSQSVAAASTSESGNAPAISTPLPVSAVAGASITEADAKAIALAHAGLAETNVTFVSVHLDYDDGRQVYEVDFYSGNTEYDYEIDAVSGQITGYDTDIENYTIAPNNPPAPPAGAISESDAKAIALARVSGATDAHIRLHLDYDDGRTVYEGSIVYGEMKYEFEINAADGTITEWDVESIYDD